MYLFVSPFNINQKLKTNEVAYLELLKKYYIGLKKGATIILNSTIPPGYTSNILQKFKSLKILEMILMSFIHPKELSQALIIINLLLKRREFFQTEIKR